MLEDRMLSFIPKGISPPPQAALFFFLCAVQPSKSKLPSAADLFDSIDTASFMTGSFGKRKVRPSFVYWAESVHSIAV